MMEPFQKNRGIPMEYTIQKYSEDMKQEWDEFVLIKAVNGTFLQTRKFLSYHSKERFKDTSIIVYDHKGRIAAVVPACESEEDGKKIFYSHRGSTFGGIVYDQKHNTAASMRYIVEALEQYLKEQNFLKVYLKITPSIYCKESSGLLQYILFLYGFSEYTELDTFINLKECKDDIIMNFNETKRKHIRRLEKKGLVFRKIETDNEVREFHRLLTLNLMKYGVKPIHSIEDLLDFKNVRLKDNVSFFGVYLGKEQLAGGMMFDFGNKGVIHAQNLSRDPNNCELDAIEYLYYGVIKEYRERGYRYLSWGISTENQGKYLNMGLIRNKESYGSSYYLNRTFYKELKGEL